MIIAQRQDIYMIMLRTLGDRYLLARDTHEQTHKNNWDSAELKRYIGYSKTLSPCTINYTAESPTWGV